MVWLPSEVHPEHQALPCCCDDMSSHGDQSDPFEISSGVKQGCVLATVLFSLFFTCVFNYAVQGLDKGVYIHYSFDGSLCNICWLTAKSKTVTDLIQGALFADDCTLIAHKSSDLQTMLKRFSDASKLFCLTISLGKTEVLFQPAFNSSAHQLTITIDGMEPKTVESFRYFGSMISNDGQLDKGISKASQTLQRLHNMTLIHHNVSLNTKLKVYRACRLSRWRYSS